MDSAEIVYATLYEIIGKNGKSLFDIAAIEGWPDVINTVIDVFDVDKGPWMLATSINWFFFVGFILIGSFFLMNFLTGDMFLKYNQAEAREKVDYTPDSITWVAIQNMIIDQRFAETRLFWQYIAY